MSSSAQILTQLEDAVFTIQFNRPDKKNAFTRDMYTAMTEALEEMESNPKARVGLITGTPDCFTAGNDLGDFLAEPPAAGTNPPVFRFIKKLPEVTKPLVAAVNGPAVGIGTTLLLHCDLVYAGNNCKFQLPFASLGACPEAASSLLLPQLLGRHKAAELLLLCEFFNAEQAKSWGLVNEIFGADYQEQALAKAKRIAAQPASSMRTTKMLLKKADNEVLQQVMDLEIEHFAAMIQSPESKEAINAFMEKRKPDFTQFQ